MTLGAILGSKNSLGGVFGDLGGQKTFKTLPPPKKGVGDMRTCCVGLLETAQFREKRSQNLEENAFFKKCDFGAPVKKRFAGFPNDIFNVFWAIFSLMFLGYPGD